jgi:hypothetical protein
MNSVITSKTQYTTEDGEHFDTEKEAQLHISTMNVIGNCFYGRNADYQTISTLLEHYKVVDRDDDEPETLWDMQLSMWEDSVELSFREMYDLVKHKDNWLVAMAACVAQYPQGCFYLCGFNGKKYQNLGYRYGTSSHEYISSFSNSEGWFRPSGVNV